MRRNDEIYVYRVVWSFPEDQHYRMVTFFARLRESKLRQAFLTNFRETQYPEAKQITLLASRRHGDEDVITAMWTEGTPNERVWLDLVTGIATQQRLLNATIASISRR
jgi:hypothetical protein